MMQDKMERKDSGGSVDSLVFDKLDPSGLPLIPRPSDDPADPLNWPFHWKVFVLGQVSWLSLVAIASSAIINPAYVVQAASFPGVTPTIASYPSCINIAAAGISPFIWTPIANVYGNRPVLMLSTAMSIMGGVASGKVTAFNQLYATRLIQGLGFGATMAIGAGVVAQMFFFHQRGRALGVYTVFLTNGAHLAAIPGGLIATHLNWRWCFYFTSIVQAVSLVVMIFGFPETLYNRVEDGQHEAIGNPIMSRLTLFKRVEGRHLRLSNFGNAFKLAKYPSIILPAICYGFVFTVRVFDSTFDLDWAHLGYLVLLGSIPTACLHYVMPSLTGSQLFHTYYGFNSAQTGILLGVSTTIGSLLGEILGGPFGDWTMRRARVKAGGEPQPEARLSGIWSGAILLPIGLLLFGFCIRYKTFWLGPAFGMGITCFAVQIVTSIIYSYVADCYRAQTSECAQLLNFTRQSISSTIGFYAILLGNTVGFQSSAAVYVGISTFFFLPVVWLMFSGKDVRERMGAPNFNKEL